MRENIDNPHRLQDKDPDAAVRAEIVQIIRRCPKKRLQIAQEMTELLGATVTEYMLDAFTSKSNPTRFPVCFIAAFCEVVGDDQLQRVAMGARLLRLVEFAERELDASVEHQERENLRGSLAAERAETKKKSRSASCER
jgi:hypothetical protein